ncbi:MAG: hypothetical protein RJA36_366 [Pseudomonadota bacterium]|jgi:hypothetical protein
MSREAWGDPPDQDFREEAEVARDAELAALRADGERVADLLGYARAENDALQAEVERLRASERSAWNAAVVRDEECERLRGALGRLVEQFNAYRAGWLGKDVWRDRIGLQDDLDAAGKEL